MSIKKNIEDSREIPQGLYCYTFLSMNPNNYGYKIKPCPFYSHVQDLTGHCSMLNVEIIDQVKECSVNDDIEEINNE